MADWHRDYDALTDRDKEQFARLVSILFDQTFLLRDIWDARENRLTANPDYRFAEQIRPLLEGYLGMSGWAAQVDSLRGVIAVYNRFGRNRQTLDKLTTYILYILRLIYDEQLEQVSSRREIVIWLRDVYEKLHSFGFVEKKLAVHRLQSTFMKLRRLSVLERVEGDGVQPESRWIVYPTIRILVSEDRINRIYEQLENGQFHEEVQRASENANAGLDDESEWDGEEVDESV